MAIKKKLFMKKELPNRSYRRTFFKNTKPKNRKRTKGRKIQIIQTPLLKSKTKKIRHLRFFV